MTATAVEKDDNPNLGGCDGSQYCPEAPRYIMRPVDRAYAGVRKSSCGKHVAKVLREMPTDGILVRKV